MAEKNTFSPAEIEPASKGFSDFFGAQSRIRLSLLAVILILIIAYLDHITGEETGFSLFYLIPVAFTAWFLSARAGLVLSVLCAAASYLDMLLDVSKFSHPSLAVWNAFLIHMGFFMLTAYLLGRLRFVLEYERRTRLDAVNNSKLKSLMVSMVSHEFGNALAQIGPAVFLLREGEGEAVPKQRETLYVVLDKVQQNLKNIVANFLSLSRLESGNFVVADKEVDMAGLAVKSLEIFSLLLDEKKIRVNFDRPSKMFAVKGDPEALALVLHNLIGNAVKYTPQGGLITVKIVPPSPPMRDLLVSVEDTGIGVPLEDRERIFSGFYRSRESAKIAKGIGVGLKVSREIIECHSGELKVESLPGKGSRFYFSLPCAWA